MAVSHVQNSLPRRKQGAIKLPSSSLKGISDQSHARADKEKKEKQEEANIFFCVY